MTTIQLAPSDAREGALREEEERQLVEDKVFATYRPCSPLSITPEFFIVRDLLRYPHVLDPQQVLAAATLARFRALFGEVDLLTPTTPLNRALLRVQRLCPWTMTLIPTYDARGLAVAWEATVRRPNSERNRLAQELVQAADPILAMLELMAAKATTGQWALLTYLGESGFRVTPGPHYGRKADDDAATPGT
jgi:hypothetical protein